MGLLSVDDAHVRSKQERRKNMTIIEKKAHHEGPFQEIFAQGVRVGDTIHLAGHVSMDANGGIVGEGDLAGQFAQCYANIANTLDQFGAGMENIVSETIHVTDFGEVMGKLEAVVGARAAAFGGPANNVAQTMVEVSALVMPELQVEITAVARV